MARRTAPAPAAPARTTRAPDPGPRPGRRCRSSTSSCRSTTRRSTSGPSVRRLHAYLATAFPFAARITIADNASTDGTWDIARRLRDELPGVEAVRLEAKGRGRALRAAWEASDAAVLAYMDVDLSTDLAGLLPLVAPLVSGHSDLAIGSRRARGSRVVRGPKRELISRGYNVLLHATLRTRFSDAQCGFKAIRADAARDVLPLMQDGAWFFDTEMLVLAERAGHADPRGARSTGSTTPTAGSTSSRPRSPTCAASPGVRRDLSHGPLASRLEALRAGTRRPDGLVRQIVRFGVIGIASTAGLRRHLPPAARLHGSAGGQRDRAAW